MLYRRSVEFLADGGEIAQAIIPAVAVDTDLDQFVGGETGIDFFQDTVAQTILGNGQTMSMEENMFIPRLGEMRFFTTHKFPLLNADGVITGIGGISRDITAARQNTQMQAVLERSPIRCVGRVKS